MDWHVQFVFFFFCPIRTLPCLHTVHLNIWLLRKKAHHTKQPNDVKAMQIQFDHCVLSHGRNTQFCIRKRILNKEMSMFSSIRLFTLK